MYTPTKNCVYTYFRFDFVVIKMHNKNMKKLSLDRLTSCLNQTRKGAYLYDYYTRIENKAGTDLE